MTKKKLWYYLEPFVYVSIKNSILLLYNTLNGKSLEYIDNAKVMDFVKRLHNEDNLLVIDPNTQGFHQKEIDEFISKTRELMMGDVLEQSWSSGKPVQVKPLFNLQMDITRFPDLVKKNMKQNLKELTIYINDDCRQKCCFCQEGYKQFLVCRKSHDPGPELEIGIMRNILNEIDSFNDANHRKIQKLNISGGDIFRHSEFHEIVSLLDKAHVPKVYITHIKNLIGRENQLSHLVEKGERKLNTLYLLISFPLNENLIDKFLERSYSTGINFQIIFIIEGDDDLNRASNLIQNYKIKKYQFAPFFNDRNMDFFEENIFASKGEVLDSKPDIKKIFSRIAINPVNFGKLVIMNDGTVFANCNEDRIGDLKKESIYDIVHREISQGKSWRRLRPDVKPCCNCSFDLLCPPLSNYEYALGRNNICNI